MPSASTNSTRQHLLLAKQLTQECLAHMQHLVMYFYLISSQMDRGTRRSNDLHKVRLMSEVSLPSWLDSCYVDCCWNRSDPCKQWPHMQSRNLGFSCLTVSNRWLVGLNRCALYLHPTQPSCPHHPYSVCTCTLAVVSGQGFLFTSASCHPLASIQATCNICGMSPEITGSCGP